MTRVLLVDDHPIWRDALERDLVAAVSTVVGAFARRASPLFGRRPRCGRTSCSWTCNCPACPALRPRPRSSRWIPACGS